MLTDSVVHGNHIPADMNVGSNGEDVGTFSCMSSIISRNLDTVENELSDWLTNADNFAVDRPKRGPVEQWSETGSKFRSNQFLPRLAQFEHSQLAVFYHNQLLRASNQNNPPLFWRLSEMNLLASKQYTHPQTLQTHSTCLQKRSGRFLCALRPLR